MKNQGFILKNLLTLMLACASMNIGAQRVINLNDENAGFKLRATTATAIPQEVLKEAKTARTFAINPSLQKANRVSVGDVVNLQLFDDCNYTTMVSDIVTDVNGNFTLTLKLPDYPFAFAIITTSTKGKSLVTVSIPEHGRRFGSRYGINSDVNYLIEIDESKVERPLMGDDAVSIPKETEIVELDDNGNPKETSQLRATQAIDCTGPVAKANPNTAATIDLLVVYTLAAAASTDMSNYGGVNNAIATMIALGNTCLSNSLAGITLRLAHSAQVSYTEPVPHGMQTTLHRLQNPSDGYMDNVHALRQQYNADLVQLITVESNSMGIGYLLSQSTGRHEYGFSVVCVSQVVNSTSAHEIGHNMGLGHGAQQTSGTATGIFPYSYGWRWQGILNNMYGNRYYCTVMAYPQGTYWSDGNGSEDLLYFSNPNLTHQGQAMGNATQADAARSLREIKHIIAYYSNKLYVLDTPTNVVVSNPTNNGATFKWDAVPNAISYRIIGPDGLSYYSTTNTTYTVSNATWYPAVCSYYEFSILAEKGSGDLSDKYTSTFRTSCPASAPDVVTQAATNIEPSTTKLNSLITAGTQQIIEQGFEYRVSGATSWLTTTNSNLSGLTGNTTYQFRAYATVESGTFYGNILTFTTLHTPPTVITLPPRYICETDAELSWSVTAGTLPVLKLGCEYRVLGTEDWLTNYFWISFRLFGLTPSTTYEHRAYALTGIGITYGNILTFTTPTPPIVVTKAATDITCNSATLNMSVTAEPGTIIEQSFEYRVLGATYWSSSTDGKLTGLTANTTYEFYHYVYAGCQQTYGDILTFTATATHTQTIDFPEIAEQTYGDEEITLPPTSDAGLTISYESSNPEVASISGNILTITGVGEAIITATQEGDCDYITATPVPRTLTVNKAPLTITAENKIRLKNQENPEFTLFYDGFKNDETESVLDVLPEIFCEADENSPAGIYDIVLSGGSDNNYQYILVDGHLEVIDPIGIDELVAKQLQIFPNPVKDELTMDNGQLIIEDIKIVDLAGKIIDNCQLSIVNSINVSTLQRGVYLLKIYTDKGLIVKRIVKN